MGVSALAVAIVAIGALGRDASFFAIPTVLGWAWAGSVLAARRPSHRMGPLLCLLALANAVADTPFAYQRHGPLAGFGWLPPGTQAAWANSWAWVGCIGIGTVVLLLFPEGRALSPRWRPAVWAALAFVPLSAAANVLLLRAAHGPAGPMLALGLTLAAASVACIVGATLAGLVAVALRWRRADPVVRAQLKWFLAAVPPTGFALAADAFSVGPASQRAPGLLAAAFLVGALAPAAIGIAVLRYRLYDIDVLLNRTVLYAAVTAGVAATYLAALAAAHVLFGEGQDLGTQVTATVLAAMMAWALRDQVRRRVDRLCYGGQGAPRDALVELGHRIEAVGDTAAGVGTVARTIAGTLRLSYVGVRLRLGDGRELAAAYGTPPPEVTAFPVISQRELVGHLIVGARVSGERLGVADERLLADLARQAGPPARSAALRHALDESRAGLVTAREEERRRLHRDLHDGLGPALAGLTLGLDTALALASSSARPELRELLGRLKQEAGHAATDVRRIVDGLRPPALDQLGLAGALRAEAARLRLQVPGLAVGLDVPDQDLDGLPAAVEMACYRIVAEALTNVVRHSGAGRCTVRVCLEDGIRLDAASPDRGALRVEVRDDGVGLPDGWRAGVGVASMRDRASELGGTLAIEPVTPRGTRVTARLPAVIAEIPGRTGTPAP